MKKSVKCAVTAALLLLLCAVGIYGIFFAPRKIGCAVDDSFSWKAYSYTPVTSKTIYNYAFPSEEITLSAENRETIVQLLADSKGKRRFPGRWTPYGTNTRIPCVVAEQIDSAEADYMLFLCRNDSEELLLLKTELHGKDRWYTLESPALAAALNTLYPYDTTGSTVTHTVGTN